MGKLESFNSSEQLRKNIAQTSEKIEQLSGAEKNKQITEFIGRIENNYEAQDTVAGLAQFLKRRNLNTPKQVDRYLSQTFSRDFIKMLQRSLVKAGGDISYRKRQGAVVSGMAAVDGYWGRACDKALQKTQKQKTPQVQPEPQPSIAKKPQLEPLKAPLLVPQAQYFTSEPQLQPVTAVSQQKKAPEQKKQLATVPSSELKTLAQTLKLDSLTRSDFDPGGMQEYTAKFHGISIVVTIEGQHPLTVVRQKLQQGLHKEMQTLTRRAKNISKFNTTVSQFMNRFFWSVMESRKSTLGQVSVTTGKNSVPLAFGKGLAMPVNRDWVESDSTVYLKFSIQGKNYGFPLTNALSRFQGKRGADYYIQFWQRKLVGILEQTDKM